MVMKVFKKDTLTHGLMGGAIGAGMAIGLGTVTLLTGGLASIPFAAALAAAGTSLGALHGAGDEGGTCRKIVKSIAVATVGTVGGAAVTGLAAAVVTGGAVGAGVGAAGVGAGVGGAAGVGITKVFAKLPGSLAG